MIEIKNFSDVAEERVKKLFLDLIALSIPGDFIIEVWNSARDVHSPEEIEAIQQESPEFNPDESSGEVWKGKIRLFRRAFLVPPERTIYVALHEIGHYITGGDEEEADEWAKRICHSYDLDKKRISGKRVPTSKKNAAPLFYCMRTAHSHVPVRIAEVRRTKAGCSHNANAPMRINKRESYLVT